MKLIGLSPIFPTRDIRKTAEYYKTKLEFDIVESLQSEQPHVCIRIIWGLLKIHQ